jgi:hypothetical protein
MAINLTGGVGSTHPATSSPGISLPYLDQDVVLATELTGNRRPFIARTANGTSRANIALEIPANALLSRFDLKVTATRADLTRAAAIADVRPATTEDGTAALVIDFGTMRTVNQVLFPAISGLLERPVDLALPWLGTQFVDNSDGVALKVSANVQRTFDGARYTLLVHAFPEMRTERLMIKFGVNEGTLDMALLAEQIEVALPELPADLSLRLSGGAPVWEHAGPVEPGSSTALDADGWTANGERLVPLADALAPFVGDATSTADQSITVELESRVPGKLALEVATRDELALHRVFISGEADFDVDFVQEGATGFDLSVPHPGGQLRTVRGLRLSLSGAPGPVRILPPLGPDANGLAHLLLGHGRAACVRLDGADGIAQITGVRLPLQTTAAGAEARIVLWEDAGGFPGTAIAEAVSEPLRIEGSGSYADLANNPDFDTWHTFVFDALPFDAAAPPWAALIVSRGEVSWSLATALPDVRPVRLGPPEGPWRAPPAVFAASSVLGSASGRLRVVGEASETEPLAPYLLSVGTAVNGLPVTPVSDGLRLEFAALNQALGAVSAEPLQVQLTSRTTGILNVNQVDVVTDV